MTSGTPASRTPSAGSAGSRPPSTPSASGRRRPASPATHAILGSPAAALSPARAAQRLGIKYLQRCPGSNERGLSSDQLTQGGTIDCDPEPDARSDHEAASLLILALLCAGARGTSSPSRARPTAAPTRPSSSTPSASSRAPSSGSPAPRRAPSPTSTSPRRRPRWSPSRSDSELPGVQGRRELLLGAAVADRRVLPRLPARHLAAAPQRADPGGPQQDHRPARPGAEHPARAVQGPPPAADQRVRHRARRQRREPERGDPLRRPRPPAAQAGPEHPRPPEPDDRRAQHQRGRDLRSSSRTAARTSSTSSTTPGVPRAISARALARPGAELPPARRLPRSS